MAPRAPAAAAAGVRQMRPGTRGAAAGGEVGAGAGVRGEPGGTPGRERAGKASKLCLCEPRLPSGDAGDSSPALGIGADSDPELRPGPG